MSEYHDFDHFGLDPRIVAAVKAMGYTTPTPIQSKAIPIVMRGHDVMGAAQTGTGKTAGFALPIIHRLLPQASSSMSPARHPVRALILAPTRELAEQVAENVKMYIAGTPLRCATVYGGVDMDPQTQALRNGVEIIVATPGRLLDHLQQKNTSLAQVQVVVLDEADRMLDMGFLPDISRILNLLPKERQSLMFSATFSEEIKKLAANFLRDPLLLEVARRNATADNVQQELYRVHESEKTGALLELLRSRELKQVLVFVNTKIGCRRLARELVKHGINADAIHGDKSQDERSKALEGFKQGAIDVLVATDVAARGLDIVELPAVINYDVPFAPEDYVHRIGRTARAGASGLAITIATGSEDRAVAGIERLIKGTIEVKPIELRRASRADRPPRFREREPARERDTAREREPTRERARSTGPTARPSAADDFFSKPYEPAAETAAASAEREQAPETAGKKPAKVATLLGGGKR
jgi:superfamily II DNA/RNA helicase